MKLIVLEGAPAHGSRVGMIIFKAPSNTNHSMTLWGQTIFPQQAQELLTPIPLLISQWIQMQLNTLKEKTKKLNKQNWNFSIC